MIKNKIKSNKIQVRFKFASIQQIRAKRQTSNPFFYIFFTLKKSLPVGENCYVAKDIPSTCKTTGDVIESTQIANLSIQDGNGSYRGYGFRQKIIFQTFLFDNNCLAFIRSVFLLRQKIISNNIYYLLLAQKFNFTIQ